jgi:hypothetical protein
MDGGLEEQEHFELYHKAQEEPSSTSILGGPALPALGHAVSGAAGSAISNVITYPLALVITRLQTQHRFKSSGGKPNADDYKDVIDAARRIYAEEGGISAFYAGCLQDTLKTMADSFLFILAYNFIRRGRLNSRNAKRLPMHEELGVGMLAGAFAKFLTTPIAQIVTRKQVASMVAARDSNSIVSPELSARDIALQIRHEKGILGFWSGYSASLILTINPSLTFVLHETFLRMLVKREKRSDPGLHLTFLMAAMSKAIASSITYPFQLAKSRAQVSSHPMEDDAGDSISEKDSAKEKAEKSVKKLERRTVFHTVAQIARDEGIVGLYQGLSGEIMKGFFSHGLTMLMKEQIHIAVVQLYYVVLKLLRRYPSPEELVKLAKERINGSASDTANAVQAVSVNVTETVKTARERGKQILNGASQRSQELIEKGMETITELYKEGKEATQDIIDEYTGVDDDD